MVRLCYLHMKTMQVSFGKLSLLLRMQFGGRTKTIQENIMVTANTAFLYSVEENTYLHVARFRRAYLQKWWWS